MKTTIAMACLILGAALAPAVGYSDEMDSDRSHPKAFVKDSAITTKIKSKLAAEHPTSMARIHVDTDESGVVWLTGTARTQHEIDRAVRIARDTEHVVAVKNNLVIKDD